MSITRYKHLFVGDPTMSRYLSKNNGTRKSVVHVCFTTLPA